MQNYYNHNQTDDKNTRAILFESRRRTNFIAYLLWFLLGGMGVHRFYLGRNATAITILIMTLTSVFIFSFFIFIVCVFLIVDLFMIPYIVKQRNEEIIQEIEYIIQNS